MTSASTSDSRALRLRAFGLTDVGRTRPHNEDAFEIVPDLGLYLVADGMGGHGNGEVASRIAVDAVRHAIADGSGAAGQAEILDTAFSTAHRKVLDAVRDNARLAGMGTTLVGLIAAGDRAAVAHVGDSRAYRYRDGRLERLTDDHSWVSEQVAAGFLSESQAREHPLKSVVTRALGGEPGVNVDTVDIRLRPGDRFLICSDGLTSMLTDPQIEGHFEQAKPAEETCRSLVAAANARGGHDNITVVILDVDEKR